MGPAFSRCFVVFLAAFTSAITTVHPRGLNDLTPELSTCDPVRPRFIEVKDMKTSQTASPGSPGAHDRNLGAATGIVARDLPPFPGGQINFTGGHLTTLSLWDGRQTRVAVWCMSSFFSTTYTSSPALTPDTGHDLLSAAKAFAGAATPASLAPGFCSSGLRLDPTAGAAAWTGFTRSTPTNLVRSRRLYETAALPFTLAAGGTVSGTVPVAIRTPDAFHYQVTLAVQ